MHHALRDSYFVRARVVEIVLLGVSVVFCATTFSPDHLYLEFGFSPARIRAALGVASVSAFAASIVLLLVDWKSASARHGDAARRWSEVVEQFRKERGEDGSWRAEVMDDLHQDYWIAAKTSVPIPDRRFNRLKAQYATKVELSKRIESHPGAPVALLWLFVRLSGLKGAFSPGSSRKDG